MLYHYCLIKQALPVPFCHNMKSLTNKNKMLTIQTSEKYECGKLNSLVEGKPRYNVVGNQHCYYQAVYGYNTCHDHRDDRLHDEFRPHDRHGGNPCTTLGCAIGRSQGWWGRETRQGFQLWKLVQQTLNLPSEIIKYHKGGYERSSSQALCELPSKRPVVHHVENLYRNWFAAKCRLLSSLCFYFLCDDCVLQVLKL